MFLERLLQIGLAVFATLGTLLTSLGQDNQFAPLFMALFAAISIWLVDVRRVVHLNRFVANLAALAVVVYTLREMVYLQGEAHILGVAQLLTLLQVILFFQRKNDRVYSQLAMLGLLQVVVAALFTQGVRFAVLLVLHLLVGLVVMCLMALVRQSHRWRPERPRGPEPADKARRWPLGALESGFTSVPGGPVTAGLSREFFLRLAGFAILSLLISAAVFIATPRLSADAWHGAGGPQQHVVGLSDTIRLGALGETLEDRREVMRLELRRTATGEAFFGGVGVYLPAGFLTRYHSGRWQAGENVGSAAVLLAPDEVPADAPWLVTQRITIEPLDRRDVFCIWPILSPDIRSRLVVQSGRQRLVRPADDSMRRMKYELKTTAFRDGGQAELTNAGFPFELPWDALLDVPELPRLARLARQWVKASGLKSDDVLGQARHIESRLRDSGQFSYSLHGQERNLDLDPIEDFVSEHRVGHCEYFATALALMLRTQGIPARVVIGFYCDEYNASGGYYQVRQLHAHAWVEAYFSADQLSHRTPQPRERGAWLRLDATPPDDLATSHRPSVLWSPVERAAGWLHELWITYVLDMDRERQRTAIYAPVAAAVQELWRRISSLQWWQETLEALADRLGLGPLGELGVWILVGIGLSLLATLAALFAWLGWRLWRRLRRGRGRQFNSGRREEPPLPDFYRRYEDAIAAAGWRRRHGQTALEFARANSQRLAAVRGDPQLAAAPATIVVAYYRVRFGGLPLDAADTLAVEQSLACIQEALRKP